PQAGEYRVINQFETSYSISELANLVQEVAQSVDIGVEIQHYDNPRSELDHHYYNPDREHLTKLGYRPTSDIRTEIRRMLEDLIPYRDRILAKKDILIPDIRWDGSRSRSLVIDDQIVPDQI